MSCWRRVLLGSALAIVMVLVPGFVLAQDPGEDDDDWLDEGAPPLSPSATSPPCGGEGDCSSDEGDEDDEEEIVVDPLSRTTGTDSEDDEDEEILVDPLSRTTGTEEDDEDEEILADPLSRTTGSEEDDEDEEILVDPLSRTADDEEVLVDPLLTRSEATEPPRSGAGRLGFFTGHYDARIASDTGYDNTAEDVFEVRNQLSLGVRFDPTDTLSVRLEGRMTHWYTVEHGDEGAGEGVWSDTNGAFEVDLREALLRWSPGDWSLTVGNQFVIWGVMDLVSPAQVVHPLDTRHGAAGQGTEALVPAFGADLRWFVNESLMLEALVVPFYTGDRGVLVGNDMAILAPGGALSVSLAIADALDEIVDNGVGEAIEEASLHAGTPDESPENLSAGARIAGSAGGVDMSLAWFMGWDSTPVLTFDPDLAIVVSAILTNPGVLQDLQFGSLLTDPQVAGALLRLQTRQASGQLDPEDLFEADYRRTHNLAADLVTYFGPVGLRTEIVFSPSRTVLALTTDTGALFGSDGEAALQTRRVPVLDAVLGLSWESSDTRWVVIGEGFYQGTFGLDDDQRPLPGEPHQGGIALAVQSEPIDTWTVSVGGIWTASSPHDVVVTAQTGWEVIQGLELYLQAIVFEGADLDEDITLAGLYDNNDQIALGLDWTF